MSYAIYIVECADKSLYVGCTNNLEKRIKQLFVATAPQSLRPAIYNSDEDTDTERSEVEVIQ